MQSVDPLISVIIPTYGRPTKLADAIRSVKEQTYKNIETIVVDDNPIGSEYRNLTEQEMVKYEGDTFIKYIKRNKNGGGSLARNSGIENASGSYISFLDDDDIYLPNKIEKQFCHLKEQNLDVSVCDMFFYENGISIINEVCLAKVGTLADFITQGNTFTPMILAKKSCLLKIKGFHDTPKFQDHLLMIKILNAGFKVGNIREKLFIHNNHKDERITLTKRFCAGYKEKIGFEEKYLDILDSRQRKHVLFRINMVKSRILTHEKGFFYGIWNWLVAIKYISSGKEVKSITKTLLRNIIFPHRIF